MKKIVINRIHTQRHFICELFVVVLLFFTVITPCNSSYAHEHGVNNQTKVDSLVKGFSFNYDQMNQLGNADNPSVSSVNTKLFGTVSLDGLIKDINIKNSYYIGLHLKLDQGWHLYWISAGSAGLPPTIKFNKQDSVNIKSIKISYPQPQRMAVLGEHVAGYKGDIYFPLHIVFKDVNGLSDSVLKLNATIFACKEQCIRRDIPLSVNVSELKSAKNAKNLHIAVQKLAIPHEIAKNTLKAYYKITSKYKGLIYIQARKNIHISDIFLYHLGLNIDKPTLTHIIKNNKEYQLFSFRVNGIDMLKNKNKNKIDVYISRNSSFFTIKNLAIAELVPNDLGEANEKTESIFFHGKIYYILLLSLVAGVILNVMPCVLPVLGLKILSITRHTHQPKVLLLFMSLGMIFTFTFLGLILLICKYMGLAIGWGMQFQSVAFTMSMAILMIILACFMLFDLSILTKIKIFNRILNFFNGKIPLATGKTSAFLNGFLATILATPCTAPFMGGVISYSLTLPIGMGWLVYTFLGIGMASPFLVASIYSDLPKILSKLTKLNSKIFIIKRLLFIPMIATAIWLLHTSYDQINTGFAPQKNTDMRWQKFEPNRIQELVKSGKTVFVDITADWCLTCKVNEKLVLYTRQGKKLLFQTKNMYAMQGDWTSANPRIANYLEKNNRYSLPFYKVYSPQNPKGELLPVILTMKILEKLGR